MPVVSKNKPYRVGKSRTGLGLFATKPIKKGKKIIRYRGPLVSNEEAEKLDNKYLFEVSKNWTINGAARSNIARYANHACRPNAESDVSPRKRRVVIRAIRDIAPGEEITYDYGEDYFKVFLKPIGCKCDHCEQKRAKKAAKARAEKAAQRKKAAKKANRKAAKTAKKKAAKTAGKTASKTASKTVSKSAGKSAVKSAPKPARASSAKSSAKSSVKPPGRPATSVKAAKARSSRAEAKVLTRTAGSPATTAAPQPGAGDAAQAA